MSYGKPSYAGFPGLSPSTASDVGLPMVDNTPDALKPISASQQAALDLKADYATTLANKSPLSTTNLDTVVAPGVYNQTSGANSTLARMYPVTSRGWLVVLSSAAGSTNGVVQIYYTYDGSRIFTRTLLLSAWSAWKQAVMADSNGTVLLGNALDNGTDKLIIGGGFSLSGPMRMGSYLLASLPNAGSYPGYLIEVTDATGGAKICRSDGTSAWLILNTNTVVS